MAKTPTSQLTIFMSLLVTGVVALNTALIAVGGMRSPVGQAAVFGLMWTPGVAAIVAKLATQRNLKGLGWRLGDVRYFAPAYLASLLIAGAPFGVCLPLGLMTPTQQHWPMAAAQFGLPETPAAGLLVLMSVHVLFSMIPALGEELGWRGYLVPVLAERFSFWGAASVSWVLVLLFHLPAILGGGYNGSGAPVWFGAVCFALMLAPLSVLMAWLRLKSGSVWPAVVAHAAHNVFIQALFPSSVLPGQSAPWLVGEFGALTPIAAATVVGVLIWRSPVRSSHVAAS